MYWRVWINRIWLLTKNLNAGKHPEQSEMVANPVRGQLNTENDFPLPPFVPANMVSRDGFGRPVPRSIVVLQYSTEQSL